MGQRTNEQEKGLKKKSTVYHRVLGVPQGSHSWRGIPAGQEHIHIHTWGQSHTPSVPETVPPHNLYMPVALLLLDLGE